MSAVHELATAIDGEVRAGTLIIIRDGERVRVVDCTATGKVMLDGRFMLGSIGDGVEHLAARYFAATVEVTC